MSIRKDDAGQMYAIEAVLAAIMMLAALYIVMVLTPVDITPRQDFAEVQLYHYGRDVLTLLSYREAEIAAGLLRYELYREHDPAKWRHDNNTSVMHTQYGLNWTRDFLFIDFDPPPPQNEPLTVRFLLFDRTDGSWRNLTDITGGTLYVIEYGVAGDVEDREGTNFFTFGHRGPKYTMNMVWFEDAGRGVSTTIHVWVDIRPEARDGWFTITDPVLIGEQRRLQYVVIGPGGTIETRLRDMRWDALEVIGARYIWDDGDIPEAIGGTVWTDAFRMTLLGRDARNRTLELDFRPGVWGGFAIWAVDEDDGRSHPIFVLVDRPGLLPGVEGISPLEAALRGNITLAKLNVILRGYIPENVGYNLHFSNRTGEIVHMRIINGIPAQGAITVTVPVFARVGVGGVNEVVMAKLVLWYK